MANNRSNHGTTSPYARHRRAPYDSLPMDSSTVYSSAAGSNMGELWALAKGSPLRLAVGVLLFVAAVALLVWNEGHAVRTSQSLDEGYNLVVSLPTADTIVPDNEGKVLHIYGILSTSSPLADYQYNVQIDAVRLKRRVQMFQWVEEEETSSEGESPPMTSESTPDVSYSYSTRWKDKPVDSGLFNIPFGHENPESFYMHSEIQTTNVVKVGAYFLSPEIVDTFTTYQPFSGDEEPSGGDVKLHSGMYYHTKDIFGPKVGDMRVQFYYAGHAGDTYSIIGTQRESTIFPYTSSSGQELVLMQIGQHSPEEVFATHHAHTRLYNWGGRIAGFLVLCGAVASLHDLVQAAVRQTRLLRDASTMSGGNFTMTVAMSLSLAAIALSWCAYRPGLAVCLVLLALLPALKLGYGGGGAAAPRRAGNR